MGSFIRLTNGDELFTDYLGVGSVIGQYAMVEQDLMYIGFRAMSAQGCLLIQLNSESLERICKYNENMRAITDEALFEVSKNGVNPIDFLSYNDLSPT
jgi:uncharacterized linocin/CFP29 family protein